MQNKKMMYLCIDFEMQNKHVKFKNLEEMKKVLLFFVVAMALTACGGAKKTDDAAKVDSTTVKVDTAKVDTAKVDTPVKK